ncbi:Scr1 family TA system antitoxin-like transcriptional regulator [Kitasatospora sp. NPDC059795]|uniref:Scr1 family TA system antitoxin-like transcriptional regulator n=1 Tax=Kitasatospora sp. NPDC059795 TaxID=3346949 RepID=UPI0036577F84
MGQQRARDSDQTPLSEFAEELRALQRAARLTPAETHKITGVPLSTIYAALAGSRLPSERVVATLTEAWHGDRQSWITLRRETEAELRTGGRGSEVSDGVSQADGAAHQGSADVRQFPGGLSGYLAFLSRSSGISIRELARKSGVNASTVSRAISGETLPKWSLVQSISTSLGLGDSELESMRRLWLAATRTAERPGRGRGGSKIDEYLAQTSNIESHCSNMAPIGRSLPALVGSPTAAAITLGNRLRRMRGNMTQGAISRSLMISASKLSRMESGLAIPSSEMIEFLTRHYRIPGAEREELHRLRAEAEAPEWWSERSERPPGALSRLFSLEVMAEQVLVCGGRAIPGLLQTEGYCRALSGKVAICGNGREISSLMELRAERQRRFFAANIRSAFMIDESALYREVGGDVQMKEQLEYLIELASIPCINIRIVPMYREFPMAIDSLTHLAFRSVDLPEVIYSEGVRTVEHVLADRSRWGDIEPHREIMSEIVSSAAGEARSADILISARDHFDRPPELR